MSEMFTEEDAENDGLIKREVGQQLNGVLSRKSGKLYTKFRQWCEENDRDPAKVLGDMVLRAMRDEAFAQDLSGTVIDLGALDRQQIREEDLELVTGLIERFDDAEKKNEDPIESLIQQRIKAIGSGPMGTLSEGMSERKQNSSKDAEIRRLEQKIDRLNQQMGAAQQNGSQEQAQTGTSTQEESQDVDDLFDSDGTDNDNGDDSLDAGDGGGDGGDDQTIETVNLGHDGDDDEDEEVKPTFSTEEADEQ